MIATLTVLATLAAPPPVATLGAGEEMPVILPLRERAALRDSWLGKRLDTLVPELMRREGIDMWILVAREYDEDPVARTMLPSTWLNARRRTILVFHDPTATGYDGPEASRPPAERFAVARYAVGDLFPAAWDPDRQPEQWKRLAELVAEKDPARIAWNVSPTFALADGLSASQRDELLDALPEPYRDRVVSGEALAVGWLETRIPEEMEVYPTICRIAHRIIAEGFSDAVIQPGHTTTSDVEWWYRERIRELKLATWFHPSVSLQRRSTGGREGELSFASDPGSRTIHRGDLLHVDLGITYLGLNTDTQQHAYVLLPDETEPPSDLAAALQTGNRLQDILMQNFVAGFTGNDVLRAARQGARMEGISATIYTHPLGYHGHGAGPTIGLWDRQDGVPGRGDYPLRPRTAYSIELAATVELHAWGKVDVMLEEDAYFDGVLCRFLDGRQTELIAIP